MTSRTVRQAAYRRTLVFRMSVVLAVLLMLAVAAALTQYAAWSTQPTVQAVSSNPSSPLAAAVADLERAITLDPTNTDAYTKLSTIYRIEDDLQAAGAVWQRAATANPKSTWPLVALAELQQSQDNYAAALQTLTQAAQIAQQDQEIADALAGATQAAADQVAVQRFLVANHLTAQEETFTWVNQSDANGWTLIGYFADDSTLLAGSASQGWFFWRAPNPDAIPEATDTGWESIAPELWVQHTPALRNLIFDGSFERSGAAGRILGFPGVIYPADDGTRELAQQVRSGVPTTVAELSNSRADINTSMISSRFAVTGTEALLLAGWVRSDDGSPYLGIQWLGEDLGSDGAVPHYMHAGDPSPVWLHVAGIAERPPGATQVETLLLNLRTAGKAMFDNVMLLPIDLPQPLPAGEK